MSFSVLIDLPSRQIGVLLADALIGLEPRAYVTNFNPEWTAVTLSSETREGVNQAEANVKTVIEQISHNIVARTEYMHPCCLPLLSCAWGEQAIASVEELYHVQISFTSGNIPIQEFSRSVLAQHAPVILLVEHLRSLLIATTASSAGSVAWDYSKPDGNFFPFSPAESQVLEKLFQFGGYQVVLSGQLCTVDFKEMNVRGQLGETASLRRTPPPPSTQILPEHRFLMTLKGVEMYAVNALSNFKDRLNREFKSSCIVLNPTGRSVSSHSEQQVTNYCRQYCIEFRFENASGQQQLHIRGSKGYVDRLYPLVEEFVRKLDTVPQPPAQAVLPVPSIPTMCSGPPIAHQRRMPSTWAPQITRCEIFPVARNSQYNQITSWVRRTLPVISILRLDRVQNRTLWERYELEGGQMLERNNGITNEMCLFHGTNKTDPYEIARSESGIDFRCSTRDRKLMWGNGAYFAEKASYSDHYAYKLSDGTRQMMVISVLTGISCPLGKNTNSALTRPPERNPGRLYDTVKGYSAESDIYVVYDHSKSCPAYIITYNK